MPSSVSDAPDARHTIDILQEEEDPTFQPSSGEEFEQDEATVDPREINLEGQDAPTLEEFQEGRREAQAREAGDPIHQDAAPAPEQGTSSTGASASVQPQEASAGGGALQFLRDNPIIVAVGAGLLLATATR